MNTNIIEEQKEKIKEISIINKDKNLKYYILTMGCKLNENDSEKLCGMLEKMNYTRIEEQEKADLFIINTCCVRENAEEKLFGKLRRNKKNKRKERHNNCYWWLHDAGGAYDR